MATVKPFRGVRYDLTRAGNPADLLAPPLYTLDPPTQKLLAARSLHNVTRLLSLPAPPPNGTGQTAASAPVASFRQWLSQGLLRKDRDPALYLYEQSHTLWGSRTTRLGVLALLAIELHEHRSVGQYARCRDTEIARSRELLEVVRANPTPVPLLYDDSNPTLEETLKQARTIFPDVALTSDDGVEHRLFCVTNPEDIGKTVAFFRRQSVMVADNHSGYEGAVAYQAQMNHPRTSGPTESGQQISGLRIGGGATGTVRAHDHVLVLLCSASSPASRILPFHRVVHHLADFSFPAFIRRLSEFSDLEPVHSLRNLEHMRTLLKSKGPSQPVFVILGGAATGRRSGYIVCVDPDRVRQRLTWIPGPPELAWADPVVFEELILRNILGLAAGTPEGDAHLSYLADPEAALQEGRSKDTQLVVLMNELSIPRLRAISQKGGRLPEQSAWFSPQPLSGLVFHDLTSCA